MRGADPNGLRSAIQRELALLAPGGRDLAASLAGALARVKAGCTFQEFVAAAKTLLTFVG